MLGCVLGAAKLLGSTREQTANAISLALAPNMALAQSRRGHLSIWKGCAGANASRNAVFAAMLAKDGFTGPTAVFEGDGGMWEAIGTLRLAAARRAAHMIGETHIKEPAGVLSRPVAGAGRDRAARAASTSRNIEAIEVDTYRAGGDDDGRRAFALGADTRETADHSLPYCVSVALLDGKVTNDSFTDARLRDPAIANLMRKVKVREDPTLDASIRKRPAGA